MLTVICSANRPLSVAELIRAAAVELGDNPGVDRDNMLRDAEDIKRICPGLIEVYDVTIQFSQDQYAGLRLAHFSVQEYLESGKDRIGASRAAHFQVQRPAAQNLMSCICLVYILKGDWSDNYDLERKADYSGDWRTLRSCRFDDFYVYAGSNWRKHYDKGCKTDYAARLELDMFKDHSATARCYRASFFPHCPVQIPTPIELAMVWRREDALARLLGDLKLNPNSVEHVVSTQVQSVLGTAVAYGFTSDVGDLIDLGADVDLVSKHGLTPLQTACKFKEVDIVKFLLQRGAKVKDEPGKTTALIAAASSFPTRIPRFSESLSDSRRYTIVQLLLDSGCKIHDRDTTGGTVLHAAVQSYNSFDKEIISLLLQRGADVNALDNYRLSPLCYAYYSADNRPPFISHLPPKILQTLFDYGADINASRDAKGRGLLHRVVEASEWKFNRDTPKKNIVRWLLEHGAEVHMRAHNGKTAAEAIECLPKSEKPRKYLRILSEYLEGFGIDMEFLIEDIRLLWPSDT